ncbi:MAG: hypothetical protein KJ070_16835 [Verrucomicrobia bacterium]|nr:hypothetical protein [Verrucomicrobiota bacterium]
MKRPTKLYQLSKSGAKRPESDPPPIWWPDENETRVINKAKALGLSLHRCAMEFEGVAAYGLFDEMNRHADPAITYCAPLGWIEIWLEEHQDIDRYVRECRKRLSDSIKQWRKEGKARNFWDASGRADYVPTVTDIRARLARLIGRGSEKSAPSDRVKS